MHIFFTKAVHVQPENNYKVTALLAGIMALSYFLAHLEGIKFGFVLIAMCKSYASHLDKRIVSVTAEVPTTELNECFLDNFGALTTVCFAYMFC